jgi:hypothetical protein
MNAEHAGDVEVLVRETFGCFDLVSVRFTIILYSKGATPRKSARMT